MLPESRIATLRLELFPSLFPFDMAFDVVLGLIYGAIPIAAVVLAKSPRAIVGSRIFWAFAAINWIAGLWHFLHAAHYHYPSLYAAAVGVKVVMAAMIMATAIAAYFALPRVMTLPSLGQLQAALLATQAKHREDAQRLHAIVECSSDAIMSFDPRGVITTWNRSAERLFGYSAAEAIGRGADLLVPIGERLQIGEGPRGMFDWAMAVGHVRVESVRRRKDGSLVHVEGVAYRMDHPDGQPLGVSAIFRDIGERKAADDRLRESERMMREILNALPAAIYTTDRDGRITYCNEACRAFAGREPEPGSDHWCISHRLLWPDGTPLRHNECPMATALKEGRPIRGVEAVAERPDGVRVPFIPYPTPLYDAAGTMIGAVNMLVDITERKQGEAALRRSESIKRAMFDAAMDCIITVTGESRIVEWNPAAEQVFGYSADMAAGRDIADLIIPPEARERHRRGMERYRSTGERPVLGKRVEVEGLRADGSRFPVELAISPIVIDGENYFTAYLRDITDRKKAEERQALAIRELHHRVRNNMAVAQAITTQTLLTAKVDWSVVNVVAGRLQTLAGAISIMSEEDCRRTRLIKLAETVLGVYRGIEMSGDDVDLKPSQAVMIAFVLHELATNAMKYGALSAPGGRVDARWSIDGGLLRLRWRESGGPRVRPPAKAGFGTKMIAMMAKAEGASFQGRYEPEGVEADMDVPIECDAHAARQAA